MKKWAWLVWPVVLCGGCVQYTCREEVHLGMSIEQAKARIEGLRWLAEQSDRVEYGCDLTVNCGTEDWFRRTEPYRLIFQYGSLIRMEIDQDELTRRELEQAVNESINVRMRYDMWWR